MNWTKKMIDLEVGDCLTPPPTIYDYDTLCGTRARIKRKKGYADRVYSITKGGDSVLVERTS